MLLAAVSCSGLSAPANGQVLLSGTTFGSVATYTCNNGYSLVGSSTRSCQSNGQWSGDAPSCSRKCWEGVRGVRGRAAGAHHMIVLGGDEEHHMIVLG